MEEAKEEKSERIFEVFVYVLLVLATIAVVAAGPQTRSMIRTVMFGQTAEAGR